MYRNYGQMLALQYLHDVWRNLSVKILSSVAGTVTEHRGDIVSATMGLELNTPDRLSYWPPSNHLGKTNLNNS